MADLERDFSYWSDQAAIDSVVLPPSINDAGHYPSICSDTDQTLTLKVANPKNYVFKVPGQTDAPSDILTFERGIIGTRGGAPLAGTDYDMKQESSTVLKLTFRKAFLQKNEYGTHNIAPTIILYSKEGRKFSQVFKFKLKVNTPPPQISSVKLCQTAAPPQKYVLCIAVPESEINKTIQSKLLHQDIAQIIINGNAYPLTVKPDLSGFIHPSESFLTQNEVVKLPNADAAEVPSGKWILYYKTHADAGGYQRSYTIHLADKQGIKSEEYSINTTQYKPADAELYDSTSTSEMFIAEDTEDVPYRILYTDITSPTILLKAKTATVGAVITGTIEKKNLNGGLWEPAGSINSGENNEVPISLDKPASGEVLYKITMQAGGAGFKEGDKQIRYVKLVAASTGITVSSGLAAWKKLKEAVETAGDGVVITIDGEIKATPDPDNNGKITIKKPVVIRGLQGTAHGGLGSIDKLNATGQSDTYISVETGGSLVLQNLTFENGNGSDAGAIDIKGNTAVSLTGVTITGCSGNSVGAIKINGGNCTLNNCVITGNTATQIHAPSERNGSGIDVRKGKLTIQGEITISGNKSNRSGTISPHCAGVFVAANGKLAFNSSAGSLVTIGNGVNENWIEQEKISGGSNINALAISVTGTINTNTKILIKPHTYQAGSEIIKLDGTKTFHAEAFPIVPLYSGQYTLTKTGSAAVIANTVTVRQTIPEPMKQYDWYGLRKAVENLTNNGTIIINGEIKATDHEISGTVDPAHSGTPFKNYGKLVINKRLIVQGSGTSGHKVNANGISVSSYTDTILETVADGHVTLKNIELTGANHRGVILTDGGQVVLEAGAKITGNKGGAAISGTGSSVLTMNAGSEISGNTNAERGGGVHIQNGQFNMNGGVIKNNTSKQSNNGGQGGGVFLRDGVFTMSGGTIEHNTAYTKTSGTGVNGEGGGVCIGGSGTFEMSGGLIQNNRSNAATAETGTGKFGQGIAMLNGQFKIRGSAYITGEGEDIYLKNGKLIHIDGVLEPAATIYGKKITATITPESYSGTVQILDAATGITLADEVKKFKVTPEEDSEHNSILWNINNAGQLEKLGIEKQTVSAQAAHSWKVLKTAIANAADGGVIYIDGEIKATADQDNLGELTINKKLTIQGKKEEPYGGSSPTHDVLNANKANGGKQSHRIFKVETGGTLILKNLMLTNGGKDQSTQTDGAAVYSSGTLTIESCNIENNEAGQSAGIVGKGGAIMVAAGSCNISNSQFKANSANLGGAIYIDHNGRCTISTTQFHFNMSGNGGGIYVASTHTNGCIINNGTIIGGDDAGQHTNTASTAGGGIFIDENANCIITSGVTIKNNSASKGGGIYHSGTQLKIEGSTDKKVIIASCRAENTSNTANGGGIYCEKGTITISNTDIMENTANHYGGGIYLAKGTITATNTSIGGDAVQKGNTAANGGGIYVKTGTVSLTDCSIEHNTAIGKKAASEIAGAGMFIASQQHTISIIRSKIQKNSIKKKSDTAYASSLAASGAGIYIGHNTAVTLEDTTVSDNNIDGSFNTKTGIGVFLAVNTTDTTARLILKGTACVGRFNDSGVLTDSNDVYLSSDATNSTQIKVIGTLSKNPAVQITPKTYPAIGGTMQVLDSSTALAAEAEKCRVTPQQSGGSQITNWTIDKDGKLVPTMSVPSGTHAWSALKTTIANAANGAIIYIDGEITATADSNNFGEITVNKNITIKGKNSNSILNANCLGTGKNHRIFNITGSPTVVIENLTLQNANETTEASTNNSGGGGIFATARAHLILNNVVIKNCITKGSGAGIRIEYSDPASGSLTMNRTIVQGNTIKVTYSGKTIGGGGISLPHCPFTTIIEYSHILENKIDATNWSGSDTLTISGCGLSNGNKPTSITHIKGHTIIENNSFIKHPTKTTKCHGMGIWLQGGNLTIGETGKPDNESPLIQNHQAVAGTTVHGTALYLENSATVNWQSGQIKNNGGNSKAVFKSGMAQFNNISGNTAE